MATYDEEVELALELITEFGGLVILRNFVTQSPPDPNKPWKSGGSTPNDQNGVPAVFLDYNSRYVDGTVIKRGDQQVLIAHKGLTLAPEVGGMVIRDGESWNIVNVETLSPNGETIMHTLQVRK